MLKVLSYDSGKLLKIYKKKKSFADNYLKSGSSTIQFDLPRNPNNLAKPKRFYKESSDTFGKCGEKVGHNTFTICVW